MTDWINTFVGVPYVLCGRDRTGWDCWGMVMAAYREQRGTELPDWRVETDASLRRLVDAMTAGESALGDMAKAVNAPRDWDICTVSRHRAPHHVGLLIAGGVLHAQEGVGTVWEPMNRFVQANPHLRWWRCLI